MFSEMRTASVEASILYLQDDHQQSQVNISGNVIITHKSHRAALEAGCLDRFQSLNARHLKGKVGSEKVKVRKLSKTHPFFLEKLERR